MGDIELRTGDTVLNIDTRGGGIRSLRVGDWDVIDGYAEGTLPNGCRGEILAPWPNRLHLGRYSWRGADYELPINEPQNRSSIHGLVRDLPWDVDDTGTTEASLSVVCEPSPGYPFPVRVGVDYRLASDHLAVRLSGENLGDTAAPFGAGMHPYFRCGADADDTELDLPVTHQLPLDGDSAPCGELQPIDGRIGKVGDRVFDDALRCADTGRTSTLRGPAGMITVELDDTFGWLMVFSADTLPGSERRRSIAVEPMTCPPNAFASGTDVLTLEPGGSWSGTWTARWAPA